MPIIWITGLPNAGKTVVADELAALLRDAGKPVVRLDGDLMRLVFGWSEIQAPEDREHLARKYVQVAEAFSAQALFSVVSVVGLFPATFRDLQASDERTLPVVLEVPEDELSRRDDRGIYRDGRIKELQRLMAEVPPGVMRVSNHARTPMETASELYSVIEREGVVSDESTQSADTPSQLLTAARSRANRTRYWDQYYAKQRHESAAESPFARAVVQVVTQHRPRAILDFGCGDGRDSFFLARLAPTIGVDSSRAAIEACSKEAVQRGVGNPEFLSTSDLELSEIVASQRPDVVYSRFVLHAMTQGEQSEFLSSISKSLQWRSLLLLECRATDDDLQRQGVRVSPSENVVGHYRRFVDPDSLRQEVERHGWIVSEFLVGSGLAEHPSGDPRVVRLVASREP